jgi:hypothetical protein
VLYKEMLGEISLNMEDEIKTHIMASHREEQVILGIGNEH